MKRGQRNRNEKIIQDVRKKKEYRELEQKKATTIKNIRMRKIEILPHAIDDVLQEVTEAVFVSMLSEDDTSELEYQSDSKLRAVCIIRHKYVKDYLETYKSFKCLEYMQDEAAFEWFRQVNLEIGRLHPELLSTCIVQIQSRLHRYKSEKKCLNIKVSNIELRAEAMNVSEEFLEAEKKNAQLAASEKRKRERLEAHRQNIQNAQKAAAKKRGIPLHEYLELNKIEKLQKLRIKGALKK